MSSKKNKKVLAVIPNLNGGNDLVAAVKSLINQSHPLDIMVVDNGSIDDSATKVDDLFDDIHLIKNKTNMGFAAAVNQGFEYAVDNGYQYVAAFNNDAEADINWLHELVRGLQKHPDAGIACSKMLDAAKGCIDSAGEGYSVWGLPFPSGRGLSRSKFSEPLEVFAASGGASLYRVSMLRTVGLFDEGFFAYYEDVDISFRAQLEGWKVRYIPAAIVHHQIGATSSKIKGFTTYQTMKNLQLLWYKNVPSKFMYKTGWRFFVAHTLFLFRAISRGQGISAIRGDLVGSWLLAKKRGERKKIQASKKVSDEYICSIMTHDLPPNAKALRSLRRKWWKITGNKHI